MSKEIEVTSNIVMTEKNEKQSNHTANFTRAPRRFSDKVILDIDGSTEKAVVYWCLSYNVWCLSYKKYVNRWFKINDKSKK